MPSDSFLNSFKESSIEKVLPSSPALLGVDLREDIYSFFVFFFPILGKGFPMSCLESYYDVMSQSKKTWGGDREVENKGTIQTANIHLINKYISP